jgi:thymidine kinase
MATLTLTYGTMSAGKSALALQLAFQLRQNRDDIELWTFGDRSGAGRVSSRLGIDAAAVPVAPGSDLTSLRRDLIRRGVRIVIVDEVQFACAEQIDELARLVDDHNVDVHTFGLGADFLLRPFPGTGRLFAIADEVRELPLAAYCWCGVRGRCNARVAGGVIQRDGTQQMIGDTTQQGQEDVTYQVLCRRHYRTGELG